MKTLALAAALMLGTAAIAQSTGGDSTTAPANPGTMTSPPTTSNDGMQPPSTTTPPVTDPMAAPAPPPAQAPAVTNGAAANPAPADAPAPAADSTTGAPGAVAATGPYPRCSRTVTDHCRQSSARESDTKGGPPTRRRPS